MLIRKNFIFDRKGRITIFGPVNAMEMIRECTAWARSRKYKKPCKWLFVPTLTEAV